MLRILPEYGSAGTATRGTHINPSTSIFAIFVDGAEPKRFSEDMRNDAARARDRTTLEALGMRAPELVEEA